MPPAYKRQIGMRGVLNWAKHWKADVIIGQFEAVLVDHARSCVWVGDDRGSSSRINKISFYGL